VVLPSCEDLRKELVESYKKYGYTDDNLHEFYRMVSHQKELDIINEIHSVVPHLTLNKGFLDRIGPVIGRFFEHVLAGNWIQFYEPTQYEEILKDGFISDSDAIAF
jgi:hypothetical protein